jgi:hypothetical protein
LTIFSLKFFCIQSLIQNKKVTNLNKKQVNPDKKMIAKVEAEIAKIKPDAAGAERLASEKRRAFEQQLLEAVKDDPITRERNLRALLAKVEKQAEPDADVVKRLNKEIENLSAN